MKQGASKVCLMLAIAVLAMPLAALAQHPADARGYRQPFWLGVGFGGSVVRSLAPSPSADRDGLAASVELGYRLNPDWAMGLEYGGVLPFSGCAHWDCGDSQSDFAPNFTRFFAFGEYRPRDSGLRLRAGFGVSRFCYRRHWDEHGWSWADTINLMLDDDDLQDSDGGTGAWQCDASSKALGGLVSVGYDWPLAAGSAAMGVRLTAEAANHARSPGTDLSSFGHRAVMLTVHFNLQ